MTDPIQEGNSKTADPRQVTEYEGTARRLADEGEIVVPIVQESLDVQKQAVTTRVRVHKTTQEHEQVVDEPIAHEDVEVERVPVGRRVDGPVPVRYEGDTMIVPLLEEELVVEKRLILREELRITRRRTETHDVRHETLRKEEATVERLPRGRTE